MTRDGIPVVITSWDSDDDGDLASDEMYVIFFDSLDENRDQSIDRSEYDKASKGWDESGSASASRTDDDSTSGTRDNDAFAKADANGDDRIDRSEAPMLADELAFFHVGETHG